ncbi:MAG: hypothetical protein IKA13_04825 [Bacteroidales bacterium]|nr:hypothetical protein [Bacteroidales bacterium]
MKAAEEIFSVIADLQRVRLHIEKINGRFNLERIYPGNYEHVMDCIHEASSNIADFWIAFYEPTDDNI